MRESGFYWVKQNKNSPWEVAKYRAPHYQLLRGWWSICGWEDTTMKDEDFYQIKEDKLSEPSQNFNKTLTEYIDRN